MAFTPKLGSSDSQPENVIPGLGAIEAPYVRTGDTTIGSPISLGTGTFTAPRYTRVQGSTPGAAAANSFSTLPSAGNLIVLKCSGDVTSITDNQGVGNTYFQAATANRAGAISEVWYAYNIGATSGTFTATAVGGNINQMEEWFGFGSNDPLYATGASAGAGAVVTTATPSTINPNAIAVCCSFAANFNTVSLVSGAPWVQDYNFGGFNVAGFHEQIQIAGAQSISLNSAFTGYSVALAVFQDPDDFTDPRVSQVVQSVIGQQEADVEVSQIVQSLVTQQTSGLKLSQVVLTILTVTPPSPPPDVVSSRTLWRLYRIDMKRRHEETA